jgi:hypothetical protein
MMDLTGLFRVWNPQYKSWSVFGQDHLAKVLLNWDTSAGGHDAGARACCGSIASQACCNGSCCSCWLPLALRRCRGANHHHTPANPLPRSHPA